MLQETAKSGVIKNEDQKGSMCTTLGYSYPLHTSNSHSDCQVWMNTQYRRDANEGTGIYHRNKPQHQADIPSLADSALKSRLPLPYIDGYSWLSDILEMDHFLPDPRELVDAVEALASSCPSPAAPSPSPDAYDFSSHCSPFHNLPADSMPAVDPFHLDWPYW